MVVKTKFVCTLKILNVQNDILYGQQSIVEDGDDVLAAILVCTNL